MITKSQLDAYREQNIEALGRENLKDISSVNIRKDLSHEDKILNYIEQIGNPYCFLSGNTPVRICFAENGKSINQALENIFMHQRQA